MEQPPELNPKGLPHFWVAEVLLSELELLQQRWQTLLGLAVLAEGCTVM